MHSSTYQIWNSRLHSVLYFQLGTVGDSLKPRTHKFSGLFLEVPEISDKSVYIIVLSYFVFVCCCCCCCLTASPENGCAVGENAEHVVKVVSTVTLKLCYILSRVFFKNCNLQLFSLADLASGRYLASSRPRWRT